MRNFDRSSMLPQRDFAEEGGRLPLELRGHAQGDGQGTLPPHRWCDDALTPTASERP